MKKIIQFIVVVFLISCTLSYNASANSRFKTASELQIYMRQNFHYKKDYVPKPYYEYFQSAVMLEFSKVGDCDDFATYSWYYLKEMGIEATRYIFWGKTYEGEGYGHAVTVFLDTDNTYSILTNKLILKTKQINPIEAIKDVYKTWKIICEWHPQKYGLMIVQEVFQDLTLYETKDLASKMKYFLQRDKAENVNY